MVNKIPGVVLSGRGRKLGSGKDKVSVKRKYTMSDSALAQRRAAPLKTGSKSKILDKYLVEKSPIPGLVSDGAVQGLRRDLYLYYLSQGLSEPAMLALDTLASLRTEMDLEKARADSVGDVLSKRWLSAAKLAIELTKGLSLLKHGSKQTLEVKHLKGFFDVGSDVVIDVEVNDDE